MWSTTQNLVILIGIIVFEIAVGIITTIINKY
jgi:hypothetical protein